MQERIAFYLQSCIIRGDVLDWIKTGWTVLLLKCQNKGNKVRNYRPITCLPLMRKLLTKIVANEIYNHLEENGILPEEQKSCHRNSRTTKDQLLIDKAVIKKCRKTKVGLSMIWIDYRKVYDEAPQSWIIKSMKMFGVADKISLFQEHGQLANHLIVRNDEELSRVNIQR